MSAGTRCPKCGYVRKEQEMVPDWQCPSCQVAYAKANANPFPDYAPMQGRQSYEPAPEGGGSFGKIVVAVFLIALVAGTAYGGRMAYHSIRFSMLKIHKSEVAAPGNSVVIYTTSWCGKCKKAKKLLDELNVSYQEHDIEYDPDARETVIALQSSGVPVIVVGDRKIIGFNENAYRFLLQAKNVVK